MGLAFDIEGYRGNDGDQNGKLYHPSQLIAPVSTLFELESPKSKYDELRVLLFFPYFYRRVAWGKKPPLREISRYFYISCVSE